MRVRAGCELSVRTSDETTIVTMLRARPPRAGDAAQRVLFESLDIRDEANVPQKFTEFTDLFGNRCQRLHVKASALRIRVTTEADVRADVAVDPDLPRTAVRELPNDVLSFISPSRYCPADRHAALAREIVGSASGYGEVQRICRYVYDRLEYRYGVSNASSCAEETLKAGAGVCRDFTHAAISLCRSIDIPARIAVGYLHALSPMDLHAWFEAYVGGRWVTFDPTEDELLGGRVVLAYGRDAADVPFITDYGNMRLESMHVAVEDLTHELADAAE